MENSPFQLALDAARRPLAFAARDDFAQLDRVRGLEESVSSALVALQDLAIPEDARKALGEFAGRWAAPIDVAHKPREIQRALRRLAHFSGDAWTADALERPCTHLPGVGPKRAELLAKRGLRCIGDLLFYLPSRYDDRRNLDSIEALEVGRRATFVGRVLKAEFSQWQGRYGRRGGRTFQAVVGDETGSVSLKWFRGGDSISKTAREGALLLVTGDVKRYRFSKELMHPEIEKCAEGDEATRNEALRRVVPDYATPEGINPRMLRGLIEAAVARYADLVGGHLPEAATQLQGLPEPAEALRLLHAPPRDCDVEAYRSGHAAARTRLVLEELYLLEIGLALRRASRAREPGVPISVDGPQAANALRKLPFVLTEGQHRAWTEIRGDLARDTPMNRLLEGDVGSGKTVVAFLAAVAVAESGHQTALMAPTELLAEQHARTLRRLALESGEKEALRIALLTASLPRSEADKVRRDLADGAVDLVVGTHSLVQKSVTFQKLALVVTDEQHRFGVKQRAALSGKSGGGDSGQRRSRIGTPHTLVMTATPIPRTLALTLHGDLDLSVIDELPPGRQPVKTLLIRDGEGKRVADLVRETTSRGEQVYIVYPLVEDSEKIDLRAAEQSAKRISRAFPGVSVDLVHGRLSALDRGSAMARFERGETQVLVSTTVIEVGVDVPGATLMVIEHAERFGLAQLHQLRGRVGRGGRPGTCMLVARGSTEDSEARLAALLETTDGFAIAEADLRIRGPGEFLGARQHGKLPDLRIADLLRDARHIATAREIAADTLRRDPTLRSSPALVRAVAARWGERLSLVGVG